MCDIIVYIKEKVMKKVIIFILLVSGLVFASSSNITVKVPVQLDKLPNDVKIDGIDVKYTITCLAKNTEDDGLYGVGYYTFNDSHTNDINEVVTIKVGVANEEVIALVNKIQCTLGIKRTNSMYQSESISSNKIKNLPQIDIKKDSIITIVE